MAWGAYRVPESELHVLGEVRGRDMLELGCGAAQWSIAARAAKRAGRSALDVSHAQLAHARRAAPALPLVQASGEQLPFAGVGFDVVFCDHGALSFCDPDVSIAECARAAPPGRLARVLLHAPAAVPDLGRRARAADPQAADRLRRPRPDATGRRDDRLGAAAERLDPGPARATASRSRTSSSSARATDASTTYEEFAPPSWARRWPAEWIWKARRRAESAT